MISAYTGTQIREAEKPFLDTRVWALFLCSGPPTGWPTPWSANCAARGQRLYGASVTVLAGKGNNGGDGLFAAALLARRGMRTTAVLTAGEAHPAGLAALGKAGGRVIRLTADNVADRGGGRRGVRRRH